MNVFWYALREKGARVYRTRPADRCPVRFIETYPKFLSQTVIVAICQRTRKRVKSESMLSYSFERNCSSRRSLKDAQADNSRSYLLSCAFRPLTKRLIDLTCINDFCDRFLILRGQRYEKSRYVPRKYRDFFAKMNYLTFPRVRSNNRFARPFFLTMLMPFCGLLCCTPRRS